MGATSRKSTPVRGPLLAGPPAGSLEDGYHNSVQKAPFDLPAGSAEPSDEPPSKSQRKRDSHALQALGERLVALSDQQLERVPLPEPLAEAIALARRVTAREGRRRQLQYIGKLMRTVDVEPLRHALEQLTDGERAATALLHGAERWRQRLLEEPGDRQQWRQQWLERHPHCPAARLDGLIAGALAESAAGQHGRQYRELFRLIRDTLAAPAATSSSTQGHD